MVSTKRLLKTIILILTLAIFNGITTNAQIALIPAFGLNISKIKLDIDSLETTPQTSYQVGGSLRMGKAGFFQIGGFFNKVNNTVTFVNDSVVNNTTLKISNALIPIQVGFSIFDIDIIRIRLMAGINLNIPTRIEPNTLGLTKDDLNSTNIQVAFGFGIDVYRFALDASFGIAMNDLFKEASLNSSVNLYTFNIGYILEKRN